jgi:hypothetical protein
VVLIQPEKVGFGIVSILSPVPANNYGIVSSSGDQPHINRHGATSTRGVPLSRVMGVFVPFGFSILLLLFLW